MYFLESFEGICLHVGLRSSICSQWELLAPTKACFSSSLLQWHKETSLDKSTLFGLCDNLPSFSKEEVSLTQDSQVCALHLFQGY